MVNGITNIQNTYDPVNDGLLKKSAQSFDTSTLLTGNTISGKLTGINGDVATIDVGGTTINARLEGNMNLKVGEEITFSLRSLNNNQITLSPLFTNLNQQEMATKAITGAGLPINQQNLELAGKMMDEGLSIDSKSINNMARLTQAYPDTSIATFSEMQKFGLDINPDTIEKFGAFKNYETQISDGMNTIMNGITDSYKEMLSVGADIDAAKFLSGVIRTFTPAENGAGGQVVTANPNEMNAETVSVGSPVKIMENTDVQGLGNNGESLIREKQVLTEDQLVLKTEDFTKTVDTIVESAKNESQQNAESFEVIVRQPGQEAEKVNVEINTKVADAWQTLNNTDKSAMVDMLKQSGLGENEAKILLSEGATQEDFLRITESLMRDGNLPDSLKDLVQSDEFGHILKSQMQAQWMLSPIDAGSKENVEQLYDRLQTQVREITDSLKDLTNPNMQLSQNLSDMNQNLDFMEQMNQVMQYVQLPLKMSGSEATGDLYVYTNKKNLAKNDGNVSALLHLDMQNLGPLDVYASITPGNNVYTKFYLQDDATIDFIQDNIHILNERLEKRGYSMKSEITQSGNKAQSEVSSVPVSPATSNLPDGAKLIKKYSFDALV